MILQHPVGGLFDLLDLEFLSLQLLKQFLLPNCPFPPEVLFVLSVLFVLILQFYQFAGVELLPLLLVELVGYILGLLLLKIDE